MSPERPPRPGSFAGDDERALIGEKHRKTPAKGVTTNHGIPVEIDPEATLPPHPAPLAARVSSYDQLAPAAKAAVEALDEDLQELKLQQFELRHSRERMDRVEAALERQSKRADERVDKLIDGLMNTHAIVDNVLRPMFNRLDTQVTGLADAAQRNKARTENFWDTEWPRVTETLEAIAPQIAELRLQYVTLSANVIGLSGQVASLRSEFGGVAALATNVDRRVAVLEEQLHEHKTGTTKVVTDGARNAERIDALEKLNNDTALVARTNQRWHSVILVGITSLATLVFSHIKDIASFIKSHF